MQWIILSIFILFLMFSIGWLYEKNREQAKEIKTLTNQLSTANRERRRLEKKDKESKV